MNIVKKNASCIGRVGLLLALVPLLGCRSYDRVVLLREYRANLSERPGLDFSGQTVHLIVEDTRNPDNPVPEGPAMEPPAHYRYLEMSEFDELLWLDQRDALIAEDTPYWERLGALKNGFGDEVAGVFTLNDPLHWIHESLSREFEAHGATMGTEEVAKWTVRVRIREMKVEFRFSDWADLVADLYVHRNGEYLNGRRLRLRGGQRSSWRSDPFAAYRPLRICYQQLAWFTLDEFAVALTKPEGKIN